MRTSSALALLFAAVLLGGCAASPIKAPTLGAPNDLTRAEGSPTEVYTRIAHGAVRCWLAPGGALAGTHIFHADAESPAKGGSAEIVIHEREVAAPRPWGRKVFRIALAAADTKTSLAVENLALPDPLVAQMKADIHAWSAGQPSCTAGEGGTGMRKDPPPPAAPAPKVAKAKPKPKPALKPSVATP